MNHFESYSKLNERLLGIIFSGKSESLEADKLRNEMDDHWKQMSSVEQDLMRKKCEGR